MSKFYRRRRTTDESEWLQDAARRRDFRHSADGPEVLPYRSRKDTKRWCRGKVGVLHDYRWNRRRYSWRANDFVEEEICRVCGRHGRIRFGWSV
jgi:hypothetical protein